jgi:hypothetical protein
MVWIEIEVDLATGRITDVACFPVSELAERLVRAVLTGRLVENDLEQSAAELQQRYIGPAQRALATAITNARETYVRWRAGQPTVSDA